MLDTDGENLVAPSLKGVMKLSGRAVCMFDVQFSKRPIFSHFLSTVEPGHVYVVPQYLEKNPSGRGGVPYPNAEVSLIYRNGVFSLSPEGSIDSYRPKGVTIDVIATSAIATVKNQDTKLTRLLTPVLATVSTLRSVGHGVD